MPQFIEVSTQNSVATVTLNRTELHNAFNDEMIAELAVAYTEIEKSQDIWTIIITGAAVLPDGRSGITEASTTRSRSKPRTRSRSSVTAAASWPMRQVPTGW